MCQGGELVRLNDECICGPLIDDKLLSKNELLARLKEHRLNLESKLDAVNKNLEAQATAAEGGD